MSVENHLLWKQMLQNWPESLPRGGVIVTDFDQIPYADFTFNEDMVLLERRAPDAIGARSVLIPFADIRGLKFVNPLDAKAMSSSGFVKDKGKSARTPGNAPPRKAPPASPSSAPLSSTAPIAVPLSAVAEAAEPATV